MSLPTVDFELLSDGTTLRGTFNILVDALITDPTGFTIESSRGVPITLQGGFGLIGSPSIEFFLSRVVFREENLTVSWSPESGETVADANFDGDELASFVDKPVTNSSSKRLAVIRHTVLGSSVRHTILGSSTRHHAVGTSLRHTVIGP